MSEVTLRIGGRAYKVACADGEETHLARLGSMVDAKLAQMSGNLAPGEAQNLLFAAILLADELSEARDSMGDDPAALADRLERLEADARSAELAKREVELELEAVRAERDRLSNDLANIKSASSGQAPLFGSNDMGQKLEQLAELIEKCADELESKLATT